MTTPPSSGCKPATVNGVSCTCISGVLTCPTPAPTPEEVEMTSAPTAAATSSAPPPMATTKPVLSPVVTPAPQPSPCVPAERDGVTCPCVNGAIQCPPPATMPAQATATASAPAATTTAKPSTMPTAAATAKPTPKPTTKPTTKPAATAKPSTKAMAMMKCAQSCKDVKLTSVMACAKAKANICTSSRTFGSGTPAVGVTVVSVVAHGRVMSKGEPIIVAVSCADVVPVSGGAAGQCRATTTQRVCTPFMCAVPAAATPAVSDAVVIKQVEAAIAGGPMPPMSVRVA